VAPASASDAEQVISELVTNAVVHGQAPVIVQIGRRPGELITTVYDAGPRMPMPRDPGAGIDDDHEPSGWGLAAIVATLSSRWTVTPAEPAGKTVTAYLPLPGQRPDGHLVTGPVRASRDGRPAAENDLARPAISR
jgi:anti-sigma regulatory factor (Ser/Thr protein kinase)